MTAAVIERPLTVAGRRLEAVELPGDASECPRAPARGAGIGRPLARLPAGAARRDRPAGDRVLPLRPRALGAAALPRTPAFFHEEALDVLPEVLAQLDAAEPVLVGHSDGGSIALIHAGHHPVAGIALLAPHVIVEDITVAAIREAREAFDGGELRERMARHHDDPDAAFDGWCDVWLDPAFRDWSLESDADRVTCPLLLIQGADDPYGTLDQLDRIEARVCGPVERLVVPGGHSPHLEAPGEVLAALVRWLGDR